jgi:hypothetical protein
MFDLVVWIGYVREAFDLETHAFTGRRFLRSERPAMRRAPRKTT